jgi:hypothetical protein
MDTFYSVLIAVETLAFYVPCTIILSWLVSHRAETTFLPPPSFEIKFCGHAETSSSPPDAIVFRPNL